MESDLRYYWRRAASEAAAATRAITPEAQAWHRKLADEFSQRAQSYINRSAA